MNTTTAPALHEEFATGLANRAARLGVKTDRAGFAQRTDYYKEQVADAARFFMLGERDYWSLMERVMENGGVFPRSRFEDRVAVVTREAWAVIEKGVTGKSAEGFALNVTREIAMMDGDSRYNRPKHAAGVAVRAIAKEITPVHTTVREDVQMELALSAAVGITGRYTKGITAPLSASVDIHDLNDTMSLRAVTEYLVELVPALKEADRYDVGLSGDVLAQRGRDVLARMTDARGGISETAHRQARRLAAHRSTVAGLEGEERDAEIARFEAATAALPQRERDAAADADEVLGGYKAPRSLNDEGFEVADDFEDAHFTTLVREVLPVFTGYGVKSADELQVILDEMSGVKVAHVPGLRDVEKNPIALYAKDRKERERLYGAVKKIRADIERLATVLVPLLQH